MRLLSLRQFFKAVQENSSQITIRDRQDIGSSSRFNDNNVLMAAQDNDDKKRTSDGHVEGNTRISDCGTSPPHTYSLPTKKAAWEALPLRAM
jgi:hypothetical protein